MTRSTVRVQERKSARLGVARSVTMLMSAAVLMCCGALFTTALAQAESTQRIQVQTSIEAV
ncbi:hypothetical protein [Nonomuraea sp. NPDC003201]